MTVTQAASSTHRCVGCNRQVPDPYGHYFASLYDRSGFFCHACFLAMTAP